MLLSYVPARVTWGVLITHKHSFVHPRSRTSRWPRCYHICMCRLVAMLLGRSCICAWKKHWHSNCRLPVVGGGETPRKKKKRKQKKQNSTVGRSWWTCVWTCVWWCWTGGFYEQSQCFLVRLICSFFLSPTILSFSSFHGFECRIWNFGLVVFSLSPSFALLAHF